jgi:phospholipid/cholesterol/gamma-HCH transport system substrate-binding protein
VTAGAGRILDDLGIVAARAREGFDANAARDLRSTLSNTRTFSSSLAATGDALQRTALRVDAASADGQLQGAFRDAAAAAADLRATAAELRLLTARSGETRATVDRVIARVDTLAAMTTGGTGTLGRVVGNAALYDHTDSLVIELRSLLADIKAHPSRYVSVHVF